MNKTRKQSSTRGQVLEFPQVEERTLFEDRIKARLQELTNLVEGFANSPFNLLLAEKQCVREALEELIVKESALRWIVRVVLYSSRPIREKLWEDIDRAVTDLEKTAESLMHAGVEWPLPDSASLRHEVICQSWF